MSGVVSITDTHGEILLLFPCAGFGNVLELPDGRLLLAVYRPRDPSRRGTGIKKEDILRYLADVEAGREKRPFEEAFPLEDYNPNPYISVLMVSEDGGRTWHDSRGDRRQSHRVQ